LLDSITLKTTGETRVTGTVQTEPRAASTTRVVLAGWEENAHETGGGNLNRGVFRAMHGDPGVAMTGGLPVTTHDPC
jgi:hypothetical protein